MAEYFAGLCYVCTSASYRLALDSTFPVQLEAVRLAMQFMKRQADRFGFRPDAVAAVGSSAGGHLAVMLATVPEGDPLGATSELELTNKVPQVVVCYCPVTTLFIPRDFVSVFMGGTVEELP
ncbi:alpha/beta hydrolase [Paenibacillus sp. UNC451MF]|uniref:alpha/beta hydrolase n=1 Tax=Paenibacillus sp. UNC451MF TaxID=1449063 RepID=UPI00049138A3|nr:alpha/beta hydrolase [Paenibacillus sp. UNC451MF]